MSPGKLSAQVAHASVSVVLENLDNKDHSYMTMMDWVQDGMPKVVVSCESEDELFQLYNKAKEANIMSSIIKDAGKTQLKEGTYTCIAIGPDHDQIVDKITGDLKLL